VGVNQVILIGNLVTDIEMRTSSGKGTKMVSNRIAINEKWKDRDSGENREHTEYVSLVFFGRQAEVVAQYCHKGSKLFIEGKWQTRKWSDNDGKDQYTTECVVKSFQMLDSRPKGGPVNNQAAQPKGSNQGQQRQGVAAQEPDPDFDDDIPF